MASIPHNIVSKVIVINRARSGINVHNFAVEVVCRLRDPKEIRTLIPIQMFGRLVRINVGTGSLIRKEFKNNITEYILGYSEKYGVPIDVLTEKIVSGKYPEKYRPKRTSKIMPLMPHLNSEISNLYAFINSS